MFLPKIQYRRDISAWILSFISFGKRGEIGWRRFDFDGTGLSPLPPFPWQDAQVQEGVASRRVIGLRCEWFLLLGCADAAERNGDQTCREHGTPANHAF
jgi:hypothetical protein